MPAGDGKTACEQTDEKREGAVRREPSEHELSN